MQNSNVFLNSWTPRILGVLRIVVGFLFVQHGTAKLLAFAGGGAFSIDAARHKP